MKQMSFRIPKLLLAVLIIELVILYSVQPMMQAKREKNIVLGTKEAYSTLSKAYESSIKKNGTPEKWNLDSVASEAGAKEVMNKLVPFLNVEKNCETQPGCMPNEKYKYINGQSFENFNQSKTRAKAKLTNGMLVAGYSYGNCDYNVGETKALKNVCGVYTVDINGFKGPNKAGVDTFWFWLTKSGIVPRGTAEEREFDFENWCKKGNVGYGCSAWAVYNENTDYLKCDSISWTGEKICK